LFLAGEEVNKITGSGWVRTADQGLLTNQILFYVLYGVTERSYDKGNCHYFLWIDPFTANLIKNFRYQGIDKPDIRDYIKEAFGRMMRMQEGRWNR
jgi:hypothetical protein